MIKGPRSHGDEFLSGHHLLKGRNRDQSYDDITKGAIRGCGGTFHSLEESVIRITQFDAAAFRVLHLSTEAAFAKGRETGAEIFVQESLVHRCGCAVHHCRRDRRVRRLLTNENNSLIRLADRSEGNGNGQYTRFVTIFYVAEKPVLLNVPEELCDDDVASVRRGMVLDKEAAAADGGAHAVRTKEGLASGRRLIKHLRDGDHILVDHRGTVHLGRQLHTNPF